MRCDQASLLPAFGGDEFVVVCEQLGGAEESREVASRLLKLVEEPFFVDDREVVVTASIGIAIIGEISPEVALRDADTAMYHAKANGRARTELFDGALRARAVLRLDEERDLRHALEHDEFHVYYQPAFLIATGQLIGFEALVRWAHPTRGLLLPHVFVPVAEETGLIGRIGAHVLQTAVEQAACWRDTHPEWPAFSMGVNVSARELGDAGFAARAVDTIATAGIDPDLVVFEITESAVLTETNAGRTFEELRAAGVHLALDDFGTGYSSLVHLKRFPIGTEKLDQSFVHGLTKNREDDAIVASLARLAHDLGLFVIAEGVETPDQAGQLLAVGCQMGQGHYWAPASPAADVDANVATVHPTLGA